MNSIYDADGLVSSIYYYLWCQDPIRLTSNTNKQKILLNSSNDSNT